MLYYNLMAKKRVQTTKDDLLNDILSHYETWTDDNSIRMNRKGGWNDVTDAYWGKLPKDWPYNSQVIDPRIRTSLLEKNSRLINTKLRGRLVPRENGDVIKARLNNAILDFQWDNADNGGSMLQKIAMSDIDARLYASKFGLVKWKYEKKDDKVLFNGNEFTPLDIRDCGMDPSCNNIKNAKWFQHREWVHIEDLETISDIADDESYQISLSKLKQDVYTRQDRRDNEYQKRILSNKGLSDHVGTDVAFPVIELVTEYRCDKWITFSPQHKLILREMSNPYAHGKIPVVQLCYYPSDDPLGESEVEPVLPLWRGIQAVLCGFLDNYATHVQPPLKIREAATKIETIIFGPSAQWLMNDPNSDVMEFIGSPQPLNYFQTTYLSLVSAFNTAMGDLSAGVSNIDPTSNKKTATEIKNSAMQQNSRDQRNQAVLSEFLGDIMMMWLSNNKQFLLLDNKKEPYLMKIVGTDTFNYFKRAGLDEMTTSNESVDYISQIIEQQGGNVSDGDINELMAAGQMPKFPTMTKEGIKPKMEINELGDEATLRVTPDDMDGDYDYIADVKSMAAGTLQEQIDGRSKIVDIIQNPQVMQMLTQEGLQVNIKELLSSIFEDLGLKDADRYFTKVEVQQAMPQDPNVNPAQSADPMAAMANDPMAMANETANVVQGMQQETDMLNETSAL